MQLTTTDGRTFTANPKTANAITTIDGYTFKGCSYLEAVTFWLDQLRSQPGYVSHPPVRSISATIEVGGTVNP